MTIQRPERRLPRRELLTWGAAIGLGLALDGCAPATPTPSGTPTGVGPSASGFPTGAAPTQDSPGRSSVPQFAARLAPPLVADDGNLLFSPWSIASVLAMVRHGAAGPTASELDALLGVGIGDLTTELVAGRAAMERAFGTPLAAANSLWGQQGLAWGEPFLAALETFAAPLRQVDFRSDPDGITTQINDWVAEHTRDKIPELLSPGMVTALTRLVLVNAVHFKAAWAKEFTRLDAGPFATASGSSVSVPRIAGAGRWPWRETAGWRGAAVPFEGAEFAFVVVQPTDAAVPVVEAVPATAFGDVLDAEPVPVNLTMPAWTFTQRSELTRVLQGLGMVSAFDPDRADFTPMTADERLHIGFVIHEAVIEVQEKGVEAAAATAAGMEAAAAPVEPRELVLDRPFGYAIVHAATSTPLFVGHVGDPTRQREG